MKLDGYQSFLASDRHNARFRAERVFEEFLHLGWPGRLLDVGCGSGDLLRSAKKQGMAYVAGVDGVQDAIAHCEDIEGDIFAVDLNTAGLPFEDASFDGVTCLEVLEHLYAPQATVREIFRVLQEGSWAILSVPNPFPYSMRIRVLFGANISDPAVIGGHIKFFRPADLHKMCTEAGFRNIKVFGLAYPTAYEKYGRTAKWLVERQPDLFATWLFACCQK